MQENKAVFSKLSLILVLVFMSILTGGTAIAATIEVNANNVLGSYQKFWGNFGEGHIDGATLSSDGQKLFNEIDIINQAAPNTFRYFRSPNMFGDFVCKDNTPCVCENSSCSSWHGIYREDSSGNPIYDWSRIDTIYHNIVNSGMKPIVELTFMPRQLLSAEMCQNGCGNDWYMSASCIKDSCIGQWDRALIGPPKDWQKWQNLIKATVEHLISEFGRSEVESWYFEVWNEPNYQEFYLGEDLYSQFYYYSVNGARQAMSNIKIGGPGVAGYHINSFRSWLDDALDNNTQDAFYSYHQYNADPGQIVYGFGRFVNDVEQIYSDHNLSFNFLKPIMTSEYGPGTTGLENNAWWKSPFPASWYVAVIDGFFDRLSNYQYNVNSIPREMILWASVDSGSNSKGMVTTAVDPTGRGIGKRPRFNVIQATGDLGTQIVSCNSSDADIKCFATKSADNSSVEAVVYRINIPSGGSYPSALPDKTGIDLRISNIPIVGTYETKYYVIDENHSNCEHPDSTYQDNLWTSSARASGSGYTRSLLNMQSNSVHVVVLQGSGSPAKPNIQILKSSNTTQASVGQRIVYTLVYHNNSSAEARNVIIRDNIPTGTSYGNYISGNGAYNSANRQVSWNLGTVAGQTQGTLVFEVVVE